MDTFAQMAELDHEQVVFCRNDQVGLRAIIAIHDTTLGPALGGCRLYDYHSEGEALRDVLRLSRGMTYKAAAAGLDLGGGKSVIIGDPANKSEALFRAFGRFVESLQGRYITAADMNTNVGDMNHIRRETHHVTGTGLHQGGSGDPAPVTAWGVYHGIRACLEVVYGTPDVAGRTIAVQGLGSVGTWLSQYLHEGGAKLLVSDINPRRLEEMVVRYGAKVVEGDDWYGAECDVLAPCAIGGIINPDTIKLIKAPIVAGGANNVLLDERRDGEALVDRKITYAPDYVINAGGLISVNAEIKRWPHQKAMDDAAGIFETVKSVLNRSAADGVTPVTASNRIARERMDQVAAIKRVHVG